MTILIDKPNLPNNLDASSDGNGELPLAFDFLEYQIGTKIAQPKDFQNEQMHLLAEGCIWVKIRSHLGESIIHEIKPGDMFKLSAISGISSTEMGTPSRLKTVIVADGKARIVRMELTEIEKIFSAEPRLAYTLVQDMMRTWHEALRNMKTRCREVSKCLCNTPARV